MSWAVPDTCVYCSKETVPRLSSKRIQNPLSQSNMYNPDTDEMRRIGNRWALAFVGLGLCALAGHLSMAAGFSVAGERLTRTLRNMAFNSMVRRFFHINLGSSVVHTLSTWVVFTIVCRRFAQGLVQYLYMYLLSPWYSAPSLREPSVRVVTTLRVAHSGNVGRYGGLEGVALRLERCPQLYSRASFQEQDLNSIQPSVILTESGAYPVLTFSFIFFTADPPRYRLVRQRRDCGRRANIPPRGRRICRECWYSSVRILWDYIHVMVVKARIHPCSRRACPQP